MALHYSQQTQAFVLRLPEHLEEGVKQRLKEGSMNGVQLTARPDGAEGLPDFASKHGILELRLGEEEVYPARIVNLPCVVEVHKTVDQVTLFKSGDVGQMVIVYASEEELWEDIRKEQEERDKVRGQGTDGGGQAQELQKQLDYYPSGLTPPTTNIVRRRFAETRMHGPYPAKVVSKVQGELAAHVAALEEKKEVAEIVEDVVDFEDYMADPTGQPITITEDSPLWLEHPELMIHREVELPPDDPVFKPRSPPPQPVPQPMPMPMQMQPLLVLPLVDEAAGGGGGGGGRGRGRGRGSRGGGRGSRGGGRGRGRGRGRGAAAAAAAAAAQQQAAADAAAAVLGVDEDEDAFIPMDALPPEPMGAAAAAAAGAGGGGGAFVDMPPPPPAHRRKKKDAAKEQKDPSRELGGRRVGGQASTAEPPPAPDLPPHEEVQLASFFEDEDGGDAFFDFLEGGAGADGGGLDDLDLLPGL